jgi:hypothetical protein
MSVVKARPLDGMKINQWAEAVKTLLLAEKQASNKTPTQMQGWL